MAMGRLLGAGEGDHVEDLKPLTRGGGAGECLNY